MSSVLGDEDLESQAPSETGAKSDANLNLITAPNAEDYRSHRDEEGEDPELNLAELSEEEPANSTGHGGSYRFGGARGSESTGGGYPPGARDGYATGTQDSESFSVKLTSMIEGITQQVQTTMEGLLNNVNEIDNSAMEVIEELRSAKDWGADRKCKLEADRNEVHRAVCRVLDVLNITNYMIDVGLRWLDQTVCIPDSKPLNNMWYLSERFETTREAADILSPRNSLQCTLVMNPHS